MRSMPQIYKGGNRQDIVGVILVKELLEYVKHFPNSTLKSMKIRQLPRYERAKRLHALPCTSPTPCSPCSLSALSWTPCASCPPFAPCTHVLATQLPVHFSSTLCSAYIPFKVSCPVHTSAASPDGTHVPYEPPCTLMHPTHPMHPCASPLPAPMQACCRHSHV